MSAATQPATTEKHGQSYANSIAEVAIELTESQEDPLMPEVTTASREPCATCGTTLWVEAVFTNNTLVCGDCAREIRKVQESPPMVPTASQRAQLDLWIHPKGAANHG